MTGYDVQRVIREIIEDTDLTNPREIAAKVAENIPDEDLHDALGMVLPHYVRLVLGQHRASVAPPAPLLGPGAIAPPAPEGTAPPGPAGTSAKVRAIRDAAPQWLRERVHVGSSRWKLLGDCTCEDLMFLARERVDNAERLKNRAKTYLDLAHLMEQHNVGLVADLPAAAFQRLRVPTAIGGSTSTKQAP
jgi:hypothetical protein